MTAREYIDSFKEKTGRLPSQVEMCESTGLSSHNATQALLKYIQEDKKKPAPPAEPEGVPKAERKVLGVPVAAIVLSIGLLVVAVLTFTLSVYFTRLWFAQRFPPFIAGAISVSMVSYVVMAPQAASYIKKGIVLFWVWSTFGIAILFSMGSTVAGQYNKQTETVDIIQTNDRAVMDILRDKEENLKVTIEDARSIRKVHQDNVALLSQTEQSRLDNWESIRTDRNMVSTLTAQIEEAQEELDIVQAKLLENLQEGSVAETVERSDFFTWIAGLLDKDPQKVEFFVAIIPAVFIDIIAALSLYVALELLKKTEKVQQKGLFHRLHSMLGQRKH